MTELNVQYNKNNIVAVFETATVSFDYADLSTWLATNNVVNSFDDKDFEGMRLDLGYIIGSLIGDDCDLTLWTRQTSWDPNTNTNANANGLPCDDILVRDAIREHARRRACHLRYYAACIRLFRLLVKHLRLVT